MKTKIPLGVAVLLVVVVLTVAACGGSDDTTTTAASSSTGGASGTITVASKNFTESVIIGEMYAQLLEKAGFTVNRKLNLGATPVAQAALLNGDIDLYPEYTGTGLVTVLKLPVQHDPQAVYATVAAQYKQKYDLVWLDPAPMNDTQALAMTQAGSSQYGVTTISEMAAKASELTMVGPPEFQAREDGLPGLEKAYGPFTLKKYIPVAIGLQYQALTSDKADIAVVFSTDGQIAADKLVVLQDDKNLFPPYQVAPVVRQQTLTAHPQVATVLNQLAPLLTNEVMQQLNYSVDGKKMEPAAVAQQFLTSQGLL
jgi:osmoprotectant transport system substrate-binding protein